MIEIISSVPHLIKNYIMKSLRLLSYSEYLLLNSKHSELWLLSYTKFGIAWLSFILANIQLLKSEIDDLETNFSNYEIDFINNNSSPLTREVWLFN